MSDIFKQHEADVDILVNENIVIQILRCFSFFCLSVFYFVPIEELLNENIYILLSSLTIR